MVILYKNTRLFLMTKDDVFDGDRWICEQQQYTWIDLTRLKREVECILVHTRPACLMDLSRAMAIELQSACDHYKSLCLFQLVN